MIVSASDRPIPASRRYPKVRSAAALKSTKRPSWSIAMTLSSAVSRIAARRASLCRRVNVDLEPSPVRLARRLARGRFFEGEGHTAVHPEGSGGTCPMAHDCRPPYLLRWSKLFPFPPAGRTAGHETGPIETNGAAHAHP